MPEQKQLNPKRESEKEIVAQMIGLYCRGKKHSKSAGALCSECQELLDYARQRIQRCPRMEDKTFCSKCPVSCYSRKQSQRIREVMRYSGPRIFFVHPILVIRHALPGWKKKGWRHIRMKKAIFVILGLVFFGLGALGAAIPILPTTPFLLLAAACFAKGSQRFNDWFCSTALYKKHLDSFVKERAMTLKTKVSLCAFATIMLTLAFFSMQNLYGRITILCLIAIKYYYFIFRIKTIKPEKVSLPADKQDISTPL